MTPIGIQLKLGGEREVETGLRRVGGAMDTVGTAAGALTRAVGGVAGAFAGALSVQEFVQAADAVTGLQNQLKLATGSAQAAGVAYNQLYEISQRSRTGFIELGKTFASISTAAADLGVSQQRLLSVTEAIGNAVTISGTGAQAAQAALQQLGQGLASGTLRGEELNSVMEQTPRLAKALADGLGVTRGELRALGEQGAITADQVIRALESQSSVLQGEVKDATLTVGQAFTQLTNSATRAVGDFDKATGATATLAGSISSLAGAVDTLGGVIRNNEGAFKVLGGTLAGAAVVAGAAGIVKSIGLIGGAVAALGAVLLANPAVLALLGLSAAVGGGVALVSAQSKTADGISQAIERLRSENERSEAAMARAVAGGRIAGADNIAKTIDARKDQISKLRAELDAMQPASAGAGGGRGGVNPQTVGAAMAQQAAGEKELIAIRQKLYGVDKDYLPTLTKLHAQYTSGAITIDEYRDLVGKLAEANSKKEKADPSRSLKSEESAYQNLIASINTKIAQEREELAGTGALAESQKIRIKLDQEMASGKLTLTAAQKASADAAISELAVLEQQQKAREALRFYDAERLEIQEELNAAYVSESKAREAGRQSVTDYARGIEEGNAALQLELSLMGQGERARTVALEQYRIELDLKKQIAAIDANTGFDEVQREEERARARAAAAIATANVSSKVFLDDWKKSVDQYDGIFRQGFADMLNNGKDGWKSFTKSLVTTFKTSVADQLYKMFAQPFVMKIVASLLGVFGGGGGAAGGAVGAIGAGASAVSTASNAFSLFNGGKQLYTLGSQYLSGTMSGANVLGSVYGNATGLGIDGLLATNGAYGTAGAGAGAASPWASAAMPAAAAAAIAAVVLNALGAFRSERRVGSGLMGTLGKGDLSPFEEWREGGTLFSGPSYSTINPVAELEARRKQLQALKDSGQGNTQQASTLQMIVDKLEAEYGDLADQTAKQSKAIQSAYDALRTNVGDMADVLGLGSAAVRAFTTTLGGADGKGLNFEGLNGDQIAAKISEALATANNELAQQVIGKFVTTTTRGTRIVSENVGTEGEDRSTIYSEVDDTRTSTRYVASEYAREGEKAIDTLTRLATSLSTVNDAFSTLGVTLLDASLSGADAASALADAFGGLERMAALTKDYYQNYYTEEERKAKQKADLDKRFAELGIKTPGSRDELRGLITDQLNQVEVQRKNRDNLVATAGKGIADLVSGGKPISITDLGKVGLLDGIDPALIGNKPNADPKEQARLNAFLASVSAVAASDLKPGDMQASIEGLINANSEVLGLGKDAGKTAAALIELSGAFAELNESAEEIAARVAREAADARDKAYRALERAISEEKKVLDAQLQVAQELADNLSGLFDVLRSNVRDLYNEVDSTRAMGAAQGNAFITDALDVARRTGYLPDSDQIAQAIDAARGGFDTGAYSTQFARDRDRLVLAGQLAELEGLVGKQLSDAERQINAIKDQTKLLDETLEYWRKQIDIANGNLDATLTVTQAIKELTALMFPETNLKAPDKISGGGGGSSSGGVFGASGTVSPQAGYTVSPTGLRTYADGSTYQMTPGELDLYRRGIAPGSQAQGSGGSSGAVWGPTGTTPASPGKTTISDTGLRTYADGSTSQMTDAELDLYRRGLLGKVPGFATGGMHTGGLRLVGERGWEVEATGPARIWNQEQLAGALGGGNADVVAELRALRADMQVLKDEMANTARNTAAMPQLADQFDSVTAGGSALRNQPVPA